MQETLINSGEKFIIIGIGINIIKSPKIKDYPTTDFLELTGIKITSNNVMLKLKRIYEKYIPILSKLDIKNVGKI